MDNCYICLEKTSIYFKLKNCNCHIICHDECFQKVLKDDKCIICKENIYTIFNNNKLYEEIENIFIIKYLDKIFYNNNFVNNILISKSRINYLLFVLYTIIVSFLTISFSILILVNYLFINIYYFIKYRNKNYNNYEKKYIIE